MGYFARYNRDKELYQKLSEHLDRVAQMCKARVPDCVSFGNEGAERIRVLAGLMGGFHDFGKYTNAFQEYLINGKKIGNKDHAHISACMMYSYMNRIYKGDKRNYENPCMNYLAYVAARLHHGNLRIPFDMDRDEMLLRLDMQSRILKEDIEGILNDYSCESVEISEAIMNEILQIYDLDENIMFKNMNNYISSRFKDERWFFFLTYMFSVLIDSDKMNSANIESRIFSDMSSISVEGYINKKKNKARINDKRDTARKEIMETVENMSDDELKSSGIFTITAPTGIGKTLASLEAALHIRERLKSIYSYEPYIITAIPFINIIEQTRKDYEELFGDTVLVNHKLQEISDSSESDDVLEEKLMRVESWDSPVVMTTFVQFFQSIFTGKNKMLKKINKLSGSIVILDEIQAIPEEYMPLIGATLHMISKHLGTKFILMTATRPKIIEFANKLFEKEGSQNLIKAVELLRENEKYFASLDRTQIIPILDRKMDNEEFVDVVYNEAADEIAVLIVVNTISRSMDLFNLLKNDERFSEREILYLSTNIIPEDRKKVIQKAEEYIKAQKMFIMVSTQTIEAGVDLDFDAAFRDLGPLSSIIQVAGRVNRGGGKVSRKSVYIVEFERDSGRVYHLHHIDWTRKLLAQKKVIEECCYKEFIEEYYERLLQNPIPQLSKDIWENGILKLDFAEIEKFELIKQQRDAADIFIEMDEKASEYADKYEKTIQSIQSFRGNRNSEYYILTKKLNDLERKLSSYMVTLRFNRLINNKPEKFSARNGIEAPFFWIPYEELGRYYDPQTGYKFENIEALLY